MRGASSSTSRWHHTLRRLTGVSLPLVLLVPIVAWLVFGTGGASLLAQARVNWLATIMFDCGLTVSALSVVRRLPAADPARWFWWAMTVAGPLLGLSNLIGFGTTVRGLGDPATVLGTPAGRTLVGVAAAILVVAMCVYPLHFGSGRERVCFWLDMATVMVGTAVFCWYFTGKTAFSGRNLLDDALNIVSGPVVMLMAVFTVARLLLAGRAPFVRSAGLIGAAGAASGGVAAAFGPVLLAGHRSGWFLALSTCADALLMLAARVQGLRLGRDPAASRRGRRQPYSILPYLAIAATFGLLVTALRGRGLDASTWTVLAGAIVSTGLVVARQIASFAENRRLLKELDATVEELRVSLRERDLLTEQMRQMAFHDNLTGLANRALFNDRLDDALARARRHRTDLAVLLLDVDDFKPVNDGYGHAAGDAVLKEVGRRLRRCVRETDLVARLGGDEFGIVLEAPLPGTLHAVVDRIVRTIHEPYVFNGDRLYVGVSVGMAHDRAGEREPEQLLRDADTAMYATKKQSKVREGLAPSR